MHFELCSKSACHPLQGVEGGIGIGVLELGDLLLAHTSALGELSLGEVRMVPRPAKLDLDRELGQDLHPKESAALGGARPLGGNSRCVAGRHSGFEPALQGLMRHGGHFILGVSLGLASRAVGEEHDECAVFLGHGGGVTHGGLLHLSQILMPS